MERKHNQERALPQAAEGDRRAVADAIFEPPKHAQLDTGPHHANVTAARASSKKTR